MGQIPVERQSKQPPEDPERVQGGSRRPHPVDEPADPRGKGSEPDYFPGKPAGDLPKLGRSLQVRQAAGSRQPRLLVGWLQAH
jgi:hypothetical protein